MRNPGLTKAFVSVASIAGMMAMAAVAQDIGSSADLALSAGAAALEFDDLAQIARPKADREAAYEEFQEHVAEVSQRLADISAAIGRGEGRQATREEYRRIARLILRMSELERDIDLKVSSETREELVRMLRALDAYHSADAASKPVTAILE